MDGWRPVGAAEGCGDRYGLFLKGKRKNIWALKTTETKDVFVVNDS